MNKNVIIGIVAVVVLVGGVALLGGSKSTPEAELVTNGAQRSTEVLADANTVGTVDIMNVDEEGMTTLNQSALENELAGVDESAEVSGDEQAGAIFMLEEEKLAHDVYRTLFDQWGMRVFDNISRSEETHIEAVRSLAEAYNISIGFYDETIGVFHDETLAGLYTELTERGSKSLDEALRVGALIEELDIVDLQRYIDVTDNQDFITVYENLQRGSRNHLRGFVRNISGDYTPIYLEQAEYDAIIAADTERGQGGQGRRGW
jgi:hypothetical protein